MKTTNVVLVCLNISWFSLSVQRVFLFIHVVSNSVGLVGQYNRLHTSYIKISWFRWTVRRFFICFCIAQLVEFDRTPFFRTCCFKISWCSCMINCCFILWVSTSIGLVRQHNDLHASCINSSWFSWTVQQFACFLHQHQLVWLDSAK